MISSNNAFAQYGMRLAIQSNTTLDRTCVKPFEGVGRVYQVIITGGGDSHSSVPDSFKESDSAMMVGKNTESR
jgi:hypothetical protein